MVILAGVLGPWGGLVCCQVCDMAKLTCPPYLAINAYSTNMQPREVIAMATCNGTLVRNIDKIMGWISSILLTLTMREIE